MDISLAISVLALLVAGAALVYQRRDSHQVSQSTAIARASYLESIRPQLVPVEPGTDLASSEGTGTIYHSALEQFGGRIDVDRSGAPFIHGKFGPGLYSVAVHNTGPGTAQTRSARMLLPDSGGSPYTNAELIGPIRSYLPSGALWRVTFIDPSPDLRGHAFMGFVAEIEYSNVEDTRRWITTIEVGTGKHSGDQMIIRSSTSPITPNTASIVS